MNVLMFSPLPTHPPKAGNVRRAHNLGRYLAEKGHKVHFACYPYQGITGESYREMKQEWESVTIIPKTKNIIRGGETYLADDAYQEGMGEIIAGLCDLFRIDIVVLVYIFQSKVLEFIPSSVLKIIDTQDKFTDRDKLLRKAGVPEKNLWFYYSKEEEAKALNRADIVMAIQEGEAEFFRSICDRAVAVVNHIEAEQFLQRPTASLEKVGFLGSYNVLNIAAAEAFLRKFAASGLAGQVKLVVAGGVCDGIEMEAPWLEKVGYLDDVSSFYKMVDLVLNPLHEGTGLKIKSVEALAHGVPIVSTGVGFEGIETTEPFHRLETVDAMLEAIRAIRDDPAAELSRLAGLSESLFASYRAGVCSQIDAVFDEHRLPGRAVGADSSVAQYVPAFHDAIQSTQVSVLIGLQNAAQELRRLRQEAGRREGSVQTAEASERYGPKAAPMAGAPCLSEAARRQCVLGTMLAWERRRHARLQKAVEALVSVDVKKNPTKKIRAYQDMVTTYFSRHRPRERNILLYTPVPTHPQDQGSRRRIYNLGRQLKARGCDIHLVYFRDPHRGNHDLRAMEECWDTVTVVEQQGTFPRNDGQNYLVDDTYQDGLGELIRELCARLDIGVVLFNYLFQSKALDFVPNTVYKIIDAHDKFTDKYKVANWYSYSREEEAKGLGRADLVLAIQGEEARYFREIGVPAVRVLGHLEQEQFIDRPYRSLDKIGILSSGHLQDKHTVEQFLALCVREWERGRSGQCRICLAGGISDKVEIDHPRIERRGYVGSLQDFYGEMDLLLTIPMGGTGQKIKTVEALAFGVPLIATREANIGIESPSPWHNAASLPEVLRLLQEVEDNPEPMLGSLRDASRRAFRDYKQKMDAQLEELLACIGRATVVDASRG